MTEARVEPAPLQQLQVRTNLDDSAVLQHHDAVGAGNRRQPVRDDERRPALQRDLQRVLKYLLRMMILGSATMARAMLIRAR
jgi:hypothetical protein